MVKHKSRSREKKKESSSVPMDLVLHNDDFNTFDFVIESLVEVCNHDPEQAEQCAVIVHYKGRCVVKSGPVDLIDVMCKSLADRNLTVTIE